jgi:cobalamin biosynthesis protein CobT
VKKTDNLFVYPMDRLAAGRGNPVPLAMVAAAIIDRSAQRVGIPVFAAGF